MTNQTNRITNFVNNSDHPNAGLLKSALKENKSRHTYTMGDDVIFLRAMRDTPHNLPYIVEQVKKQLRSLSESQIQYRIRVLKNKGITLAADPNGIDGPVVYPNLRTKKILSKLKSERKEINQDSVELKATIVAAMFEKNDIETTSAIVQASDSLNKDQRIRLISELIRVNRNILATILLEHL